MMDVEPGPWKPKQRRWAGRFLKIASVVGFVAAFLLTGLLVATVNENLGLGENGQAVLVVVFYAILGVAAFLVYRLYRRGRQHTALLGEELVTRDARPPVVYLRSFTDEVGVAREEEVLATILGEAGPFVAIGRPGDPLPPLGASRFYVAEPDSAYCT